MFPGWLRNTGIAAAAFALSCVHVFGSSPGKDRLLRLVPANAQIVAGIQDPHHGDESARLLIVTQYDNMDLRDWIALARVDDRQQVNKVIEAAASSERGELSEHLLLAGGSFRGRKILQAAIANGGADDHYRGVRVVEVMPSTQELKEMHDPRWLAAPNDNTVIFGSPAMVKSALDRYVAGSPADAELVKRMSALRPDVNCWSVLNVPGPMLVTHLLPGVLDATGAAVVRQVTSLSVSIHYGSKERVDFAFATADADAASALAAAISGPPHLLPAADTLHSHLEGVSVRENEVRGSVRVAEKEFDPWLAGLYARLSATPQKENVTQIAGR